MKAVSIKIYHFSKWTLLVFLICVALISLTGRTLLNNVAYFKNAIEQELADYGIKGVVLDNIEGHWQGLQPFLKIKGASLSIPGRSHALSVNELSLRVKLVPSLLSGDLILESFHSSIEKLVLVRDVNGSWWLNDIPLMADTGGNSELGIYEFFQRLPTFVNIDIGLIQLRDLRHQVDYLIQNTTLRSSRKKQKLSLELISQLPSTLGYKIELFLTGDAEKQQVYIKANSLDLPRLFQLTSLEKIPLQQAVMSMQSWVDMKRFHVNKIISEASVRQLSFRQADKNQQALNFSFLQKASVETDRWILDTRIKNIHKGKQSFTDVSSQMLISKKGDKPLLWIDQTNLSFLHSMLQDVLSDESVINLLDKVKPVAMVKNVVAELDIENPIQSIIGFDFAGYTSQNYLSIPAIRGLDGSFVSARGKSQIDIDAKQMELDFGDLFRAPIKLNTLTAKTFVHIKDSKYFLQATNISATNEDASVQGRMDLQASANKRPFVSIRAKFDDAKVESVSPYLPVKIMHENVVNWLDKSLLSGQISSADFLFHGRLQKPSIFTEKQSGVMLARVNVVNPMVDYLAGWPVAGQGKGYVEFLNTSMQADFKKVKYASTRVDRVQLQIPDFLSASLLLTASSKTKAKDLLSTLSRLPVLNVFDEVKRKTTVIAGPVNTEVKLDIPLSSKLKKKLK